MLNKGAKVPNKGANVLTKGAKVLYKGAKYFNECQYLALLNWNNKS